jgi:hypothetical protein
MSAFKRKHEEYASAPPAVPDSVVRLLYALCSDWDKTLRFVVIVSVTVIACCLGTSLVLEVALLATGGINGLTLRYVLPIGALGGGSLITCLTIVIKKFPTGSRTGAANNDGERHARH